MLKSKNMALITLSLCAIFGLQGCTTYKVAKSIVNECINLGFMEEVIIKSDKKGVHNSDTEIMKGALILMKKELDKVGVDIKNASLGPQNKLYTQKNCKGDVLTQLK